MAELIQAFEQDLQSATLVPSDGGRFEVTVDGTLLYSKLETGRHAEPGEVLKLMRAQRGRKA
jgi:selenoprotein W-related protein